MVLSFSRGMDLAQECTRAAWRRMCRMLFAPFMLEKWFILGFAAWLANLGQGAGGFNLNLPTPRNLGGPGAEKLDSLMQTALQFCRQHPVQVAALAILVFLLVLALAVLVTWVSSRGRFVFLDCAVGDHLRISSPWSEYRAEGESLFWWRLGFGVVVTLLFILLAGGAVALFFLTSWPLVQKIVLIAMAVILFLLLALAVWTIGRVLDDVVVPFMYRDRLTATAAWRRTGDLLRDAWPGMAGYLLLYIALSVLAALAVLCLIVGTCCLAGCLMMLPYIGTVLLLPMLLFFRLYSVYFFQELAPDVRLIVEPAPAVADAAAPEANRG